MLPQAHGKLLQHPKKHGNLRERGFPQFSTFWTAQLDTATVTAICTNIYICKSVFNRHLLYTMHTSSYIYILVILYTANLESLFVR